MPGTTRRVIVLTAWAVYVKPDLSTLVVDLGLTGLPDVVGIDTVRIVIPRLKVPLIFKSRRVIVLTAWAVYVKPDLSTLVVDLGLTGLPDVVGIDTVRIERS